jgi:putative peptidoglycan lipid II flippase
LNRRIGKTGVAQTFVGKLWLAAGVAAGAAWGVKLAVHAGHPILQAAAILTTYGTVYFGIAAALRIEEVTALMNRLRRFI